MRPISVILFALLFALALEQLQAAGPALTSADLPGWTIEKPDLYNDKQLFGYIDGGAELYLEYGFKLVTAWRCQKKQQEFVVDVYEMVSPAAAFGIWSISRRTCAGTLPGSTWSCVTPNQILYARGTFLVNITLYDKNDDTRESARKIASTLLKRIAGKEFALPPQLSAGPMAKYKSDLRLLQGPLAVQGSLSEWIEYLEGIQRFDIYHANTGKGKQATSVGFLRFRSPRDLERFIANTGISGKPLTGKWSQSQDKTLALKPLNATSAWFLDGGTEIGKLMKSL